MAGRSDTAAMEAFVSDLGVTGFPHVVDDDGTLWAQFDVLTQPAFAFIDNDGTITVHTGALGADALANQLEELLAK